MPSVLHQQPFSRIPSAGNTLKIQRSDARDEFFDESVFFEHNQVRQII
jgi:hypothetical protein